MKTSIFFENGGHWRPPKFMNVPDELRNTLFMFWEAQKYTSCKVFNDQNLWPPMEDHLASNEPPKQLTFLRSSRHILTSTEYKI